MPTKSQAILSALTDVQSFRLDVTSHGRTFLLPGWIDKFVADAGDDGRTDEFEYDRLLPNGGAEFSWYMSQYVVSPEDWAYLQYQLRFEFPGITFKACEDAVYEG